MAAKVPALKKSAFYVVVDEYTDHPETGELMLKQPVFRTTFCAVNNPAYTDTSGVAHSPVKVMVAPDATNGIYPITVDAGHSGEKAAIMNFMSEKYAEILGPFDTPKEAHLAKHEARPKTRLERIGRLEHENAEKDDELAVLRARVEEMEKGKGTPPPPAPKPETKPQGPPQAPKPDEKK